MSTTAPAPAAPHEDPSTTGPLAQDEPLRPVDFGLDWMRLRRLRRIVFAILAIPILLLALLALRFVSMPITQAWHGAAYDHAHYDTAMGRLAPVDHVNLFEPYLPHLTRGTDLLRSGQDAAAEKELHVALTTWQKGHDLNQPQHARCKILNNLSISIERQAEKIKDPAARGDRLFEAEQLLAPCAGGGGGGQGGQGQGGQSQNGNEDKKTTGENGKRVEKERKDADKQAGKNPDARGTKHDQTPPPPQENPNNKPKHEDPKGKDKEEAPTNAPSEDSSKKDKLNERNKGAQGGDGDDSSQGADEKPAHPW